MADDIGFEDEHKRAVFLTKEILISRISMLQTILDSSLSRWVEIEKLLQQTEIQLTNYDNETHIVMGLIKLLQSGTHVTHRIDHLGPDGASSEVWRIDNRDVLSLEFENDWEDNNEYQNNGYDWLSSMSHRINFFYYIYITEDCEYDDFRISSTTFEYRLYND